MDGFLSGGRAGRAPEGKRRPVRRPRRVEVAKPSGLSVGHPPGRAAIKSCDVNPARLALESSFESKLPSVGRPAGHCSPQWRQCEMESLAPIRSDSNKCPLRDGDVSQPFSILREFEGGPGYPSEFGNEPIRPQVVAKELIAVLVTCDKQALAVQARKRPIRLYGSGGQLDRLAAGAPEIARLLAQRPDIQSGLKHEIFPIRSPIAAARVPRRIPTG